ncbi:hypothetical protein FRB95_004591 [Tulasnella sp. JGI-2019a]|nr:hypothetical protein FRB95_004591 [Tulasnella sp. JGI-2019a]
MSAPKLCKNCGQAPARAGYDFCGRTCGQAAKKGQTPNRGGRQNGGSLSYQAPYATGGYLSNNGYGTPSRLPMSLCLQCGSYPKNDPYDYCSVQCGQAAARGDPAQSPSSLPLFSFGGPANSIQQPPVYTSTPGVPCAIPGCPDDAHPGSKYCSQKHREEGVKQGLDPACLMCQKYPRTDASNHFCGRACANKAAAAAPILLNVPTTDPRFADVSGQFTLAWKHTPKPPKVVHVYKIILPQKLHDSYEAYRAAVEARGNFSKKGMQPGNERRRWHGTTRKCTIGDDPKSLTPCSTSGCSICAIIRSSYDVSYAAMGMFGKGIYTSATSSKSDGYTSSSGSANKAMFLNRVVVGKGHILTQAQNNLTAAPPGCDSVIANAGAALKNDELIVYNNDAIRTSWLLIYSP